MLFNIECIKQVIDCMKTFAFSLGKNISLEKALEEVEESYKNKKGYEKLKEFVSAQGGNIDNIEISSSKIEIISDKEGYITNISNKINEDIIYLDPII